MKMKKISTISLLLASILLASACGGGESSQIDPEELAEPIADMANPAAVYCGGLGYAMENVTRNGGEDADCIFPDESRCGQWDFLSGRCGQEFSYCSLQGYNLGEGINIGTCQFPDGSICDEFLFFSGHCSPGDNPAAGVEEEPVQILDFSQARDYLAAYFSNQYGIEAVEPWIEQNITPEDAVGSSTVRFVSGPLTIVISALASAPSPSEYTIKEASNISNGFYWEGSLSINGEISETRVIPPGSIFNEAQARDAVMEFIAANYDLHSSEEWIDRGITQTEKNTASSLRVFASGSWVVEVEFEPAAPLISSYQITIENLSEGIRWEGEINLQGEITEISFQK